MKTLLLALLLTTACGKVDQALDQVFSTEVECGFDSSVTVLVSPAETAFNYEYGTYCVTYPIGQRPASLPSLYN